MFELLGIPPQALFGQVMLGLINGAFYAMLSLGFAVIFGLLNIINFAHGALYMMGAVAWFLLQYLGLGYWWAFMRSPIAVGLLGALLERLLLKRIYGLDHLSGLLLTFGLTLGLGRRACCGSEGEGASPGGDSNIRPQAKRTRR
jgi:branched-chain amino acid transport system permease protein